MRVLVVHNAYVAQNPSGENAVVATEIAGLRAAGTEVLTHLRSSDEIPSLPALQKAWLPVRPLWSPPDVAAVRRLVAERRPDVLHLHNPYPLISPGVVRAAASAGVPVVMTVHNHRLACANGLLHRDGHDCTECLGRRVPTPAVRHACYRGSRAQSLVMATTLAAHRGTFGLVDRFLVLTESTAATVRATGVPAERLVRRVNTVPDPGPPTSLPADGAVVVARLSPEKGVADLVTAWRRRPTGKGVLTVVGDGDDLPAVRQAAGADPRVVLLGRRTSEQVHAAMTAARVVIVPSRWPEAMPLVVLEAWAAGRPVLATDVGGLGELVDDPVGWTCRPGPEGLAEGLQRVAATSPAQVSARGRAARHRWLTSHSPSAGAAALLAVYRDLPPRPQVP